MTCICTCRKMHNIMYESFKGIHHWKSIYWFSASLTSRIGKTWAWSCKELKWNATKQSSLWAEFTELHKKLDLWLSIFSVYISSTRFQIYQWKVLQKNYHYQLWCPGNLEYNSNNKKNQNSFIAWKTYWNFVICFIRSNFITCCNLKFLIYMT